MAILPLELEVGTENPNALLVERSDQWYEIPVSRHEHGNVDCVAKADLEGVDGERYIGALFAAGLGHGQVPGLNPSMHQVVVSIAIYPEMLRCGLLAREETLVPCRIHYFVARVSLLLLGYERFEECVKRLIPEPPQVGLMIVVALGTHEEVSIVEYADSAYRVARGHRSP